MSEVCTGDDTLVRCLRRVSRWPVPPNWSRADWLDEARACASLAECQAYVEFDPAANVPMGAFLYQRVMAGILTRYRQEWSYAGHCPFEVTSGESVGATAHSPQYFLLSARLDDLLAHLTPSDRWLLEQSFWQHRTEAELASELGISQQAVSRRKHVLLASLKNSFSGEL